MRKLLLATVSLVLASPALAEGLVDWNLSPPEADLGGWTASLGALAGGTLFTASDLVQQQGASLSVVLYPRLERTLDNGWDIGARGAILATHDRLAGDIYGNRTFEKAYLFAQTPYGRFEAGQDDGAAYRLSVTGPNVDDQVSIDNASTTFFRDPTTGRAFIDIFRLRTPVFASSNDAKFTYVSPRWFGIALSGSYTPYDAHGGLPFVSRGHGGPDRQQNLIEGAVSYQGAWNALSYGFYGGAVFGRNADRTDGHANLRDWGLGGEAEESFDGVKLAFGGGWRQSNAYAFDIADARESGHTQSWRLSTTATKGPWIAGFEYAGGRADAAMPGPGVEQHGFEASVGYVLNSNLQLTCGWQGLAFRRSSGVFFNDAPNVTLNAGFLHLRLHV
ncbi:MAG TPA: porin [Rhizomicrobium sp.]|nr:porin [Rhizomicrobium sp.]